MLTRFPLIALYAVTLLAQTQPPKTDFSGRWRMIKARSDFAGFKTPAIVTRTVEQQGVTMNVHTVQTAGQKSSISDLTYNTDGTPTQNVINGRDAESRTYWDGGSLVVKTTMKASNGDNESIEDRWTLSDDKQTLTTASHIETDKGEVDMILVCGRQSEK